MAEQELEQVPVQALEQGLELEQGQGQGLGLVVRLVTLATGGVARAAAAGWLHQRRSGGLARVEAWVAAVEEDAQAPQTPRVAPLAQLTLGIPCLVTW